MKRPEGLELELDKAKLELNQYKGQLDKLNLTLKEQETVLKEKETLLNNKDVVIREKELLLDQQRLELSKLNQQVLDLKLELDQLRTVRPMIKIDALARQMREEVENLNNEITKEGRPRIMVDQFEVEIKGGLDFKDGICITQLQGQELSPDSVSTIKFALRTAPVIKIVDD